jgi:hypothetical protein
VVRSTSGDPVDRARPLDETALHRAESMQGDDTAVGDMLVGLAACDVAMRQFVPLPRRHH